MVDITYVYTKKIVRTKEIDEVSRNLNGKLNKLRHILLSLVINDLPSRVSSSVRLSADDCLLYRVIGDHKAAESLQTEIDHLQEREKDWQMVFNPDKCEHIRTANMQM